nr:DUF3826 domain-containing protein [Bacteroides sp. 214]
MKIKQIVLVAFLLVSTGSFAQDLNSEGRDPAYVDVIVKRSQKIIDQLGIDDSKEATLARVILCNRYFELNDIYEVRDAKVKLANETLEGEAKEAAKKAAEDEKDAALYRSHFAFTNSLAIHLNAEQVSGVKDGMTYGVLGVTYKATCEMIPSLTAEEKMQIYAWLVEARELAIDAESANKKHAVFGKYKGRINNYLAKRGYNLTKEREEWYKRIEEAKKKE